MYGTIEISANSIPDKPENWGCSDWMAWHQKLVAKHGRKTANQIWRHEWDKQGSFDRTFNFCKYSGDFINYFDTQGMNMRSIVSGIFTGAGEIVTGALDTVDQVVDTAGGTAKFAKVAIPALVIVGVGVATYFVFKKGDKVLDIVGMIKPSKK